MSDYGNPSEKLFTIECESCKDIFYAEDGKCLCGLSKGKLQLDVDGFLNKVYDLHVQNEDDRALDVVFDVFWQLYDKYDIMSDILGKVDMLKIDEGLMVGFMVQTFKYVKKVPNHPVFCDRAAARMRELGADDKRVHDLVDHYRETGNYWENMRAYGVQGGFMGGPPEPK